MWVGSRHINNTTKHTWWNIKLWLRTVNENCECPVSSLLKRIASGWLGVITGKKGCTEKEPNLGLGRGEKYLANHMLGICFKIKLQIHLVHIFQYFIMAHRREYGKELQLQAILKPTSCFQLVKSDNNLLLFEFIMYNVPCLVNTNVKDLFWDDV